MDGEKDQFEPPFYDRDMHSAALVEFIVISTYQNYCDPEVVTLGVRYGSESRFAGIAIKPGRLGKNKVNS